MADDAAVEFRDQRHAERPGLAQCLDDVLLGVTGHLQGLERRGRDLGDSIHIGSRLAPDTNIGDHESIIGVPISQFNRSQVHGVCIPSLIGSRFEIQGNAGRFTDDPGIVTLLGLEQLPGPHMHLVAG